MGSIIRQPFHEFKQTMTYGLGRCTAIIIKTDDKIIFGHHPDQKIVYGWIKSAINIINIFIKLPTKYIQNQDGKWIDNEKTIFDDIQFDKKIEKYTPGKDQNHYMGTLYCKKENDKIMYTDCYGIYHDL
jgi:hypothetical protein